MHDNLPSKILPWDNFKNWIYCIIVVKFDLELGQTFEMVYPQNTSLNEKERMNICFLSFPDSNSSTIGDTIYHFRLPIAFSHRKSFSLSLTFNKQCLPILMVNENSFYGYVFFRQVKDPSSIRGYFQKSLIILSKYTFHNLFYYILNMMAPFYFENGVPALESASNDIDQWPPPKPGILYNLPFMGKIIKCRIPKGDDLLNNSHILELYQDDNFHYKDAFNTIFIPNLYEFDIYNCLCPIISQIHLLWELVLICQPILVIGTSPSICSSVVEVLISLIWPIKYAPDYRPYFTIQDQDFKRYISSTNDNPPSVLLGVTNPFFAKTLQHWPHIVRINPLISPKSSKIKKSIKRASLLQPFENKTGVYTKYKTYINKDKWFLNKLNKNRPTEVKNALIRRHFTELTQSFMIPLERYIASLLPLFDDISPFKKWTDIGKFNEENFLKTIKQNGPHLTSHLKGDWEGLYRKYFLSPNFANWCDTRVLELKRKVEIILSQKLQDVDFHALYAYKTETEIVDVIINLRDKLKRYLKSDPTVFHKTIIFLESQIKGLIDQLPQDLQISIK
ncbi:unnamed protein product [Gordionus sp. m RMFG-2023]